jgi:hypothetical protein
VLVEELTSPFRRYAAREVMWEWGVRWRRGEEPEEDVYIVARLGEK